MSFVVENLTAAIGRFRVAVERLEVPPGNLCCLVGRSGSGKSTILNAIAGFTPIITGRLLRDGKSLDTLPPEKRRIAFVFQKPALFSHLTVLENVGFALRLQGIGSSERDEKGREWLRRLEIEALERRYPHQLSGGQAQRVALARAFIAGFPVLLLDEPFASLDVSLRSLLRKNLLDLVRLTKVSAILVTHDSEDVWALADSIAVLEAGKIVQQGTSDEIRNNPSHPTVRELLRP